MRGAGSGRLGNVRYMGFYAAREGVSEEIKEGDGERDGACEFDGGIAR
jgi:hypothetical protein